MTRSVVALGSNLGDRLGTLRGAVEGLRHLGEVVGISGLYESDPVGGPEQDSFLNAVVLLDTDLDAEALLAGLHRIEAQFDRVRDVRWGPRTLDLDLVLHGDTVVDTETLTIPHPRFTKRRFVLEPLAEVWPDGMDQSGTRFTDLLPSLSGQRIERVRGPEWVSEIDAPTRSSGWVISQFALLVVFIAISFLGSPSWSGSVATAAGVGLLAAGSVLLAAAFIGLGRNTRTSPVPAAGASLVESGVYRYARHPMYGGVLLVALAWAVLKGSVVATAVWPLVVAFFFAKSRYEEGLLVDAYPGYGSYRQRVPKRFVPFVG